MNQDMDDAVSSDEAHEEGEVEKTFCENSPPVIHHSEDESFMSQDAQESLSCAKCNQTKERIEYLQKIRSNQKQRLLDRNRQIMELKKENQNLKRVSHEHQL